MFNVVITLRRDDMTPPTILQTAPAIGGCYKRGRSHLVDYSDGFRPDLNPFDQRPDDFPTREPIGFAEALFDPLSEIRELADHQA